ncbi:unnamed protein product [Penicillium salamii]|nr:unnamed protein product [Penicillium salamii]CAG8229113.1 unnamed protein product [Penicillium salamii]CAG8398082.1 unnamed protein product [Penicillium salamii]
MSHHTSTEEHDQTSSYERLPRLSISSHSDHQATSQSSSSPGPLSLDQIPSRSPYSSNPPTLSPSELQESDRSLTSDTWIYEGVAMVFSVLCFIATITVLRVYEHKARPNLAYGITLNAIISILATGSKSSLLFVIGECIGQLKWVWFYKGKKKEHLDMQLFDSASRGPMGSLIVAFKHRGRSFVSLGAFILVFALVIDPFMQQVLVYPIRPTVIATNSHRAAAKQAVYMLQGTLGKPMAAIVSAGVWSDDFEVTPSCPSGNCTWPAFQSMGMCSQCEELTPKASLKCDDSWGNSTKEDRGWYGLFCYIDIGQGISGKFYVNTRNGFFREDWLAIMDYPEDLVWSPYTLTRYIDNFTYVGVRNPQAVVAHAKIGLASNHTTGLSPLSDIEKTLKVMAVTQCALAICSRTYQIAVTNGITSINVSSPNYGQIFNNSDSTSTQNRLCWKPDSGDFTPIPRIPDIANELWASDDIWANRSTFSFCPASTYNLGLNGESTRNLRIDNTSAIWRQSASYAIYTHANMPKISMTGLRTVMKGIAASYTKDALTASEYTIGGTIITTEVYVRVKWLWVIFPAVLTVLGVIFFISTILVNRGHKLDLWKSSIMAVLFHGLDAWEEKAGDGPSRVSQMEKTAQQIKVNLRASDDHNALMLDRS